MAFIKNHTTDQKSLLLFLIFFLAFSLRLSVFAQCANNPLAYNPELDEAYYFLLGKSIAAGYLLGEKGVFFMDPLYGYFLGLFFFLFGGNIFLVKLFQIFLDSINALLVYVLAAKVWDRRAGLAAGFIYAIYKVSFFYAILLLKVTLTLTFSLSFIWALIYVAEKNRMRHWFYLGLFAALLTYLRANLLLFAPLALFAYWVIKKPPFRKFMGNGLVFLAGISLLLSLGTIRNYYTSGEWIVLNTQSGRLLYLSNNPENMTGKYSVPSFSRANPSESERDFHAEAERLTGKEMTRGEVSTYWKQAALRYLLENPLAGITLAGKKFLGTIGWFEIPNNQSFYLYRDFSGTLAFPLPAFPLVLALGLPGLAVGIYGKRSVTWLLVPITAVLITVLIFYTSSRFRFPAVPFFIIGSGIGLAMALEWTMKREFRKVLLFLFCAGILAGVSCSVPGVLPPGNDEYLMAKAYWKINKFETAEKIAREALEKYPDQARFAILVGVTALSARDYEKAVKWNQIAARINRASPDAYYNIGLALLSSGRAAEAIPGFRKAIELKGDPVIFFSLGRAYEATGDIELAQTAFKEFLARTKPANPYYNMAKTRLTAIENTKIEHQRREKNIFHKE